MEAHFYLYLNNHIIIIMNHVYRRDVKVERSHEQEDVYSIHINIGLEMQLTENVIASLALD